MKIVQWCDTADKISGSKGAERYVQALCRGLQKLGHTVVLKANSKADWIETVFDIPKDFDVVHHHGWNWDKEAFYAASGLPWCSTIHGGGIESDPDFLKAANNNPHVICVSKFIADRLKIKSFVHSASLPEDFIFNKEKKKYFLYLAGFDWGYNKGLDIFLTLSKIFKNYEFWIAGAGSNIEFINYIKELCTQQNNLKFVGEVNGKEKAEVLSNAKAYILPTKLPDACPLTVSEALMSGTPIITSANGAMPEIVPSQVGFVCNTMSDYTKALVSIDKINTQNCRDFALENYSDIAIAKKHLLIYENLIKTGTTYG